MYKNTVLSRTTASVLACLLANGILFGEARALAPAPTVTIQVLDAESGEPIQSFRILRGAFVNRPMSEKFAARGDGEAVNWQPHTTKIGSGGTFTWPLTRSWKKTALRVEADGYIPQRFTWILKEEGSRDLEFRLAKDPGVPAKVLLPDGKPASHALVGLALIQRNVRIKGGSIVGAGEPLPEKPGDRWRRPTIVETNRDGEFVLTTETDPASAVVAVHPRGICEMTYAEFENEKILKLKEWGRIEGTVTIGDKPGVDEKVTLSTQRHHYGYPGMVAAYLETRSDATGRFVIEKVPPGLAQVSLPEYFPEIPMNVSFTIPIPPDAYRHIDVKSGEKTVVDLGGKGLDLKARRKKN